MTKKYNIVDGTLRLNKKGFTAQELLLVDRGIDLYEKIIRLWDRHAAEGGDDLAQAAGLALRKFHDAMVEHFTSNEEVKKCFSGHKNYDSAYAYDSCTHKEQQNIFKQIKDKTAQKINAFEVSDEGLNPFEKDAQDFYCVVEAIKNAAIERVKKPGFGNRGDKKTG